MTIKDYADNEDARKYDKRLRGPVDEGKELKVDPETGLKVYIASEKAGIETSAGLVRKLFEKSIELGRKYHKENNKADFYEALRLLGTGLHCLEGTSLEVDIEHRLKNTLLRFCCTLQLYGTGAQGIRS